jgi:hypothetical protein
MVVVVEITTEEVCKEPTTRRDEVILNRMPFIMRAEIMKTLDALQNFFLIFVTSPCKRTLSRVVIYQINND